MSYFRRSLAVMTLLAGVCCLSQAQLQAEKDCQAAPPGGSPCVYQVDPPNWWTEMPSPMLLLYGRNLKDARISVHGGSASVTKTQFSDNGHYAFVWLRDAASGPHTIQVRVASSAGNTSFPFELKKRKAANAGFRGFSAADSLYLIMTDRFAHGDTSSAQQLTQRSEERGWHGGDFRGIENHLDYIQQLGITSIWITPAYNNDGARQAYHGYSATNMYQTDPHFGSVEDYERLAQAIHAHGMKFVLDTVPNHVGAAHPWALDPPTPDWFHGTVAHHDLAKEEFRSLPDPHATWKEQKDVTQGWFVNVLPDLNQENPLVAQYLIQNAIWWIETGALDGLRIDTFPYVGRAFWQQFNGEIQQLYPHLTEVGEVFNPDPTITSFFAGGAEHQGIDTHLWTPFDFPTFFAIRSVFTGKEPMSHLEEIWRQDRLYPHPERLVPFLGNHDTPRFMSLPGVTLSDLKLALGVVMTMRGMPQLYSGDEIAMRGAADPDNRHDFPGGFPGDAQNAFTASGRTAEQNEVHDWVAALLHFRNAHPAFAEGGQQELFDDATAMVYLRARNLGQGCSPADSGRVLVAVNNATQPRTLELDPQDTALAGCTGLTPAAGTSASASIAGGKVAIQLAPKQIGIFEVR